MSTEYIPRNPAPAVTRASSILRLLATNAPMPLTDIANQLGLPKSSTLNLCLALENSGLIQHEIAGYALGPATVELGGAYVARFDLVREFYRGCNADPVLAHELAQIAMRVDTRVLYLARHEGRAPLRLTAGVGDLFPASITAVGSILLAQLSDAHVAKLYRDPEMPRWTENSVTTLPALLTKLHETRERGYAIDDHETAVGVYGLAILLRPSSPNEEPLAIGASLFGADQANAPTVLEHLTMVRDRLSVSRLLRPLA